MARDPKIIRKVAEIKKPVQMTDSLDEITKLTYKPFEALFATEAQKKDAEKLDAQGL